MENEKIRNRKHYGMTNLVAQIVMLLKMQIFSPGLNKILNEKNVFLRSQNLYQKKYSKFSFNHTLNRILTKSKSDAHPNMVRQLQKAMNCHLSCLREIFKIPKNVRKSFFLSWPPCDLG